MIKIEKTKTTTPTQDEPWGEAHELAALERMFAIGLRVLRDKGLRADHVARNLATRSVSTEREFATSLATIALMTREEIDAEVARVRRIVAAREAGGDHEARPLRERVLDALRSASGEERVTSDRERELHCGGQVSAFKAVLAMIDEDAVSACPNHTALGYQPWCPACNPHLHRNTASASVPIEHQVGFPQMPFVDLRKAHRVRLGRGSDGAFVEVTVTTLGRIIVRGNPGPLVLHPLATNVVEIEDGSDVR